MVIDIWLRVTPDNLKGNHVHTCPICYEDMPCDDECSWEGDYVTNDGIPICHHAICDRCAEIEMFQNGGGI
jgi:hypothetical protein